MGSSHLMKNSAILLSVFTFGICLAANIDVEIDPMELGEGDYMSKRTGASDSDSIVVGSFSTFLDPGADYKASHSMASELIYVCKKQLEDYDAHRQEFETKIRKRTGDGSSVLTNREALAEVPVTDYFVYVSQEVWICTGNKESENPTFYRVRNVLFSIKDIREVHFGLGVSVSVIKHHLTLGKRVKIEEIQYFVQDSSTKQLTKTSKLLIKSYKIKEDDKVSIPNLSKTFVMPEVKKTVNSEGMAQVQISSTGETLKIGTSWKQKADYIQPTTTDIRCKRIKYWNPASFRPEVYKIQNIPVEGTTDQHRKIIEKFTDEQFEDMFTIIERIIMKCEHYQKETYTITNDPAVYLVKHDIIGKRPIKNVSLFPRDLTDIHAVKLTGNDVTVRYTDISFYICKNWTRVEKDTIHVSETIRSELVRTIVNEGKNVKETTKEVHYHLGSGNVFSTFIDEVGYHLRVGTQAVQTIIDNNDAICEKILYDDSFKTDVTILMNKNGVIHSQEAITGDYWKEFFAYNKQEAFLCKSATESIYRVVNWLSFSKPVSEIQTFDGVEISTKRMLEKTTTVEIKEVKYINSITRRVVKYLGLLIFDEKYYPLYDSSKEATKKRVMKTEDEIISLIDLPKTLEKFTDSESSSEVSIGGGPYTLEFIPNQNMGVEKRSATTVLYCKLTDKPLPNKPLAMFHIEDSDEKLIHEMDSETDSETNLKYFEGLKTEVWICNPKQLEEGKGTGEGGQDIFKAVTDGGLIRVVNKQKLKSPAPKNVGIISYQALDKVWIAGNGDSVTTNAQNVRYYKIKSTKYRTSLSETNFAGHRVLDRTPKDISETWKSGTRDLTNDFDNPNVTKPIRIYKTLHPPVRRYKKIFNEAGHLDLVIGSQWKKVFGNKDMTILCQKSTTEGINEKYKPELKANDVSANFASYFDLVSQEVWECTVEDVKIRRVVNTFKMDYEKIGQFSVKHLYFYDGIAVSYGKYGNPETSILEIGEVKYLSVTDDTVLKYEGMTNLKKIGSQELATHLPRNQLLSHGEEKRDFVLHDVLGADGVFKTDVGSSGIIVEVGAKISQTAELILDNLECTSLDTKDVNGYSQELQLNKYYVPRIFYYFKDDNTNILKRTEVSFESFTYWFEKTVTSSNGEQIIHICQSNGNTYIRVMTRLIFLSSVDVAAVYHYDGVTIHTYPKKGRTKVEITEVKFYKQQGDSMKMVKFDGFVSYRENEKRLGDRSYFGHEIRYYLDTPILHFKEGFHVNKGIAIEIGSPPDETFETHEREKVICVEVADQQEENDYVTEVFTNFPVGDQSTSAKWAAIKKDFHRYFYERSQRLWNCTKESKLVFHAVINVMVMAEELHVNRAFLRDGVKMDIVTLPDNLNAIETTELKFFTVDEQSNIKIISYVGEIVFETIKHPIVDKLFSGSYESKINRLFSDEAIVEEGYSYIQLLAYYERVKRLNFAISGCPTSTGNVGRTGGAARRVVQPIKYLPKGETKIKVMRSQFSVLHVYGDWEYQMTSTEGDNPDCLRITWKHGYPTYIPKIVEYVDDRQYEFDEFDLHRTFNVKTLLWICQSMKNEFVHIHQYLNVKQPLNAVMYSGSVDFQEPDSNGNNEYLHIHVFIDMKTKKLVKYVHKAFEMPVPTEDQMKSLTHTPLQFLDNHQE